MGKHQGSTIKKFGLLLSGRTAARTPVLTGPSSEWLKAPVCQPLHQMPLTGAEPSLLGGVERTFTTNLRFMVLLLTKTMFEQVALVRFGR